MMNVKKREHKLFKRFVFLCLLMSFAALPATFAGCAASKANVAGIPKIDAQDLLDELLAQQRDINKVRITGTGSFDVKTQKTKFRIGLVADRQNTKLGAYITGPVASILAILWLSHEDTLSIFIPMQNRVYIEPVGVDIDGQILPPASDMLTDMFTGIVPLRHFVDSLVTCEPSTEGYYLTFRKNNEILVALVKPNPWHVESYQWIKNTTTQQIVDVRFDGFSDINRARPQKLIISAPMLDQQISINIDKEQLNGDIPDSLFVPVLPENVTIYNAFK